MEQPDCMVLEMLYSFEIFFYQYEAFKVKLKVSRSVKFRERKSHLAHIVNLLFVGYQPWGSNFMYVNVMWEIRYVNLHYHTRANLCLHLKSDMSRIT